MGYSVPNPPRGSRAMRRGGRIEPQTDREAWVAKFVVIVVVLGVLVAVFFPQIRQLVEPVAEALTHGGP